MPARNEDLHGNAPDKSPVVLLLIDWINSLDFPEGRSLLEQALPAADRAADSGERPGRRTFRRFMSTTTSAAGGQTSAPRSIIA